MRRRILHCTALFAAACFLMSATSALAAEQPDPFEMGRRDPQLGVCPDGRPLDPSDPKNFVNSTQYTFRPHASGTVSVCQHGDVLWIVGSEAASASFGYRASNVGRYSGPDGQPRYNLPNPALVQSSPSSASQVPRTVMGPKEQAAQQWQAQQEEARRKQEEAERAREEQAHQKRKAQQEQAAQQRKAQQEEARRKQEEVERAREEQAQQKQKAQQQQAAQQRKARQEEARRKEEDAQRRLEIKEQSRSPASPTETGSPARRATDAAPSPGAASMEEQASSSGEQANEKLSAPPVQGGAAQNGAISPPPPTTELPSPPVAGTPDPFEMGRRDPQLGVCPEGRPLEAGDPNNFVNSNQYTFRPHASGTVSVCQHGHVLWIVGADEASASPAFQYRPGIVGQYLGPDGQLRYNLPNPASAQGPSPPPSQAPRTSDLPTCPSLAIGPSGLPSCTNGRYVFVPTANNTVEVFESGELLVAGMPAKVAATRYGYVPPGGAGAQPVPQPTSQPSSSPGTAEYTFKETQDGNIEIYRNGERVSTGTPEYAAQFGYVPREASAQSSPPEPLTAHPVKADSGAEPSTSGAATTSSTKLPRPTEQPLASATFRAGCGYGHGSWLGPYPIAGQINQDFGVPWIEDCDAKIHTGLDIQAGEGSPVKSVSGGRVKLSYPQGNWGYAVVVKEDDYTARAYLHLKNAVPVETIVQVGMVLGKTNSRNHVHYNVCRWSRPATNEDLEVCSRGALGGSTPDKDHRTDPLFPGPFIDPRTASTTIAGGFGSNASDKQATNSLPSQIDSTTSTSVAPTTTAPAAPPPVSLQVNGINSSYSTSSAPYAPTISLGSAGFNALTEIRWWCTMPNGASCDGSPYAWTQSNWTGKFNRTSDSAATLTPTLVLAGDPAGEYQWTVDFIAGSQQITKSFTVTYTPPTPQPSPAPAPAASSTSPPLPSTSPGSASSPAPTSAAPSLAVNGVNGSYSTSSAPYTPAIALSGSRFNALTEIRWFCTMPNGSRCEGSPYSWTPSNWAGKFNRTSDSAATATPTLVLVGDPAGTFQWTVTFIAGSQQIMKPFAVKYTPSSLPPPSITSPGSVWSPGPTTGGATVNLTWNAVSGATQYDLGIRDITLNQLVVDQRVNATSFKAELMGGRQYRWNVAACNASGCSSFTTALYFRTP